MTEQMTGGMGSGENPAVQVVSTANAPTEEISVQNAAELLTKSRQQVQEPAKRPAPKREAPVAAVAEETNEQPEDGAATGDAGEEIDLDGTDSEAEEATPNQTPPPESWSEADKELWSSLTPDVQQRLLTRERQREAGVKKRLEKIAADEKAFSESRAAQEAQLTTHRQHLEAALQNTQAGIINRLKTDFADVDPSNPASLAKLAGDDPGRKVLFDELWKQLGATQYQAKQIEAKRQAEFQAEMDKFATSRIGKLLEMKPELADPVAQKQFETEVVGYLTEQRKVDPQRINQYDAEELIMAHESMLYRKALAARKAKQTQPGSQTSTPTVRAGQPRDSGKSEKVTALENKAKKSGRMDDVLSLYRAKQRTG